MLQICQEPLHTTCFLGGFQEKYSWLIQEQTPANSVVRHDWNFKRDGFCCQMKLKKKAANTLDGLGAHKDRKYVENVINRWIFNVLIFTKGAINSEHDCMCK